MELPEAIKTAFAVFAEHQHSDDESLQQALVNAGISPGLATKLLEFMPLAFGRVFLDGMGIKFEDYYLRQNPRTKENQKKKLSDEVVYRESFEVASFLFTKKVAGEVFKAVAFRSSEFKGVNNAMNDGSQPENLVMSLPIMLWDEEVDAPPHDAKPQQSKNRWHFWK